MVTVNYTEPSAGTDQYLRYSQLIIDAFTKALDQNDCTVKMLVGVHDEISEYKNTVQDLVDVTSPSNGYSTVTFNNSTYIGQDLEEAVYTPNKTVAPETISAIKARLRSRCIDCNLSLPKIDFSNNLDFSLGKLKASLKAYTDAFKDIANPNFCQASTVFNFACLQDLIKLIALFLTAFTAILSLRKLANISLKGLIRGIISGLLGAIIGQIHLQLDTSQTGIKCILEAIKQLASNIPDGESLSNYMDDEWFQNKEDQVLFKNTSLSEDRSTITIPYFEDFTTETGEIKKRVAGYKTVPTGYTGTPTETTNNTDSTKKSDSYFNSTSLQKAMSNLKDSGNQNYVKQFANALQKDADNFQRYIDNSFKYINDTADKVLDTINTVIKNIFGLLEYFQCELERSGGGFVELLDYIKRVINVINLLSSIVGVLAKQQVKKLCKTKSSTYDLSDEVKELLKSQPNDLDPTAILSEYMGKVVDKTTDGNDNIIPLIYDEPKDTILPKLSLETCNFHEFVEAHKLDNVINSAIESIRKDEAESEKNKAKQTTYKEDKLTDNDSKYNKTGIKVTDEIHGLKWNKGTHNRDKSIPLESSNNRRWTLYPIQYVVPNLGNSLDQDSKTDKDKAYQDLSNNIDKSFGVNTILDFIYNNPTDKINKKKEDSTDEATTFDKEIKTSIEQAINMDTNKTTLKTPKYSEYDKDSKAYLNKCRDIDDVLSILEQIQE